MTNAHYEVVSALFSKFGAKFLEDGGDISKPVCVCVSECGKRYCFDYTPRGLFTAYIEVQRIGSDGQPHWDSLGFLEIKQYEDGFRCRELDGNGEEGIGFLTEDAVTTIACYFYRV